jgi:hypothetical protein
MHLRLALAALLLAATPAFAADKPASFTLQPVSSPAVCATDTKETNLHVTQLACCKKSKGVCGCRAGKIVCCDNTVSNEPGCTCHGDEAIVE